MDVVANDGDATLDRIGFTTQRSQIGAIALDGGRIVESGTHDELVSREGAYASLWAVQTGAAVRHGRGPDPSVSGARPS